MEKIIEELRENGQRIIDMITWGLKNGDELYWPEIKEYDYIMCSFESIRDSYDVEDNITLEFIDVDKEKNTLAINEDKLQRVAKEINQKRIEGWRAKGENMIKNIIDYVNILCKDRTKEEKKCVIIAILASPTDYYNLSQSYSMGFIELDEEHSIPVINEEKLLRRAKGKNVEILREKLLNNEMSFTELDEILEENGYKNVIYNRDDDEIEDIKEEQEVEYVAKDTDEAELLIYFDITKDNERGEYVEDFYLKVTYIERI